VRNRSSVFNINVVSLLYSEINILSRCGDRYGIRIPNDFDVINHLRVIRNNSNSLSRDEPFVERRSVTIEGLIAPRILDVRPSAMQIAGLAVLGYSFRSRFDVAHVAKVEANLKYPAA